MTWVYLVVLYSVIKGVREILKKKSLELNSLAEVLFFHTLIGLVLVIPTCTKDVFNITLNQFFVLFLKSFVIFVAWILSFTSIKHTPVSFCGVMDLSRILFSTLLAIIVLGETMTIYNTIGFILVIIGIFLVNFKKSDKGSDGAKPIYVILLLISCFLNAISGLIDKIVMKDMTSAQVQFWYMLFLAILYFIFLLVKQGKNINCKTLVKNPYIWIISIIFIIGDRGLFIANADPNSKVTVMTLIKQSSVFIVILLGKLVFKEKNIAYKMLCASIIVAGILISLF